MFREQLSLNCPPSNANAPNGLTVYRLVTSSPAVSVDFDSHIKLRLIVPTGANSCRGASCSVYDNLISLDGMMKLPKPRNRYRYVAELTLHADSGVVNAGKDGHYDWWIYKNYHPERHSKTVKSYEIEA